MNFIILFFLIKYNTYNILKMFDNKMVVIAVVVIIAIILFTMYKKKVDAKKADEMANKVGDVVEVDEERTE